MRKVFLLILCLLSLTACNKKTEIRPVTQNLCFTAETVFSGTEYQINAKTDSESNLSLTIEKPDNLNGLKLNFNSDNIELDFFELKREIPLNSLEEDSILKILYEGFSNINKVTSNNGQHFSEFEVNDTKYRMIFTESGIPLKLESENKEIIFKGMTISD